MKRMLFILIVLAIFISIESNATTTISLKEKVTVTSDNVYLKDIAEDIVTDKLSNIFITKAPLPGKTKIITKEYLKLKLMKYNINVEIAGSNKVRIFRSFKKITKEMLEKIIFEFLLSQFKDKEFEYELISYKEIIIPAESKFEIKIDDTNMKPISSLSLPLIIVVNNQMYTRFNIGIRLKVYDYMLITTEVVKKGEELTENKLKRIKGNILEVRGNPVKDFAEIVGKVAKRALLKNKILDQKDIVEKKLVTRGEIVKILAYLNGVYATTYGEALEDGKYGQLIKVRNINSRKELNVKVVDKGLVEVVF